MILYRFMSDRELELFLAEVTLISDRDWHVNKSTVDYFVFFDDSRPIECRIPLMVGRANLSNVAEFSVINRERFERDIGSYQILDGGTKYLSELGLSELFFLTKKEVTSPIQTVEYRAKTYSARDLQILRIGSPGLFTGIRDGEYMIRWKGVDEWKAEKENS